jgi:outer membrane protein OmpA-like peptidoglycan-associated protein
MLRTLLWIIGLPLAAFVGWYVYVGWTTSDLQRRTDAILAGIPALTGYPVRAHVERGAARIWVTGLAPDEATRHLVLGRLKELAPAAELAEAIGVLPRTDVDARLGVEGLRRSVERAGRRLAVLATDLSAARARAPDAPESAALAGAERTARDVLLAFEAAGQDATSGSLDQPVRRALADLWEIERQLGRLGGASNQVSQRPPSSAVEAAEAIVLVADRMSAEIAGFEQRRAVAPIASSLDAVGERVVMVGRSLESVEERLRARIADLERRLQEARPRPPSPREKLETFARSNAVFFAADAEFRDPRAAAATLDALAALMKETEIGVRIVGYTDEIGAAARNSAIAQSRADTVAEALAARGIPRARLLSVGRTFGVNLAPGAGMDSPNRRVEFELAFPGEKAGSR